MQHSASGGIGRGSLSPQPRLELSRSIRMLRPSQWRRKGSYDSVNAFLRSVRILSISQRSLTMLTSADPTEYLRTLEFRRSSLTVKSVDLVSGSTHRLICEWT